jgi:hypothetical protein
VYHLLYALAINIFFWIASIPDIKMYVAYKRAGEFDKAGNRFAGLDSEFTLGPIVKLGERLGWKKRNRSNPENQETRK